MPNIMRGQRAIQRPAPLTLCPSGADGLAFATYWYRFPGIEGFFICSKCFEDELANTQFAGLFDVFYNEPLPGTKSICDFNSERTHQILAQAIRSGNTDMLFEYAERRANILPCDGLSGTRGGSGVRWVNNAEMPGFIACEACYEDYILASSFASRFTAYREEHPPEEVWICDLAMSYVKRSLIESSRRGDWYSFVNAVNYRLSIPACESSPVLLSTRKWFKPIRPWLIPKVMACEACYLDHAGSLEIAYNFTRVHPKFSELQNLVLCSFQKKPIKAYSEHLLQQNYARWHHLVNIIATKPSCAKDDIDGEWYTLPDPRNFARNIINFDICGACYLGFIEATGHASAFRRVKYPPGTERVCDFSPTTPRFEKFMQKWSEMVYTGDTTPLIRFAARITNINPCSRSKDVERARWWGMDEFFFCAECYEEVGKTSYFAALFNYKAAAFPVARCDMYTDNMRRRYMEACQERSLDEFMNYCRYREEVWQLMKQETHRYKMAIKMSGRSTSHGLLLTAQGYVDPGGAMVPVRPDLATYGRRVSAPAKYDLDHRMTEENLKRAQRRAVKESAQLPPALVHLQSKWSEVE